MLSGRELHSAVYEPVERWTALCQACTGVVCTIMYNVDTISRFEKFPTIDFLRASALLAERKV